MQGYTGPTVTTLHGGGKDLVEGGGRGAAGFTLLTVRNRDRKGGGTNSNRGDPVNRNHNNIQIYKNKIIHNCMD